MPDLTPKQLEAIRASARAFAKESGVFDPAQLADRAVRDVQSGKATAKFHDDGSAYVSRKGTGGGAGYYYTAPGQAREAMKAVNQRYPVRKTPPTPTPASTGTVRRRPTSLGFQRSPQSGSNGLMVNRKVQSFSTTPGSMTGAMVPNAPTGNGLMRRRSLGPGPGVREVAPTVGGVPATADAVPGVSERLQALTDSDSPYIQRRRTKALQHANRRGLLASSIAAGAGEAAAIDAALPIAQADASIAANERAMRSQEFQQYRAIRSQELMQQNNLGHDAAQREADRELSVFLQGRDHRFQELMQTGRFDHDAAMQQANREMQALLQQRSQAFAGEQAGLDRSQQRELQGGTIEASERLAQETAVRDINAVYQQQITALSLNTNIPIEERRALEDHYAFIRDQSLQSLAQIYDFEPEWTSARRREEQQ